MKMLVTGGSGFVGRALLERAAAIPGWHVRTMVRRALVVPGAVECFLIGDLGIEKDLRAALVGVDVVVHAAARVHVMNEDSKDALQAFRRVNVAGTLNLAAQAEAAGVRRFIFLSSIKVNGERTIPGKPFEVAAIPDPVGPYGISKLEAEMALREMARSGGMQVTVVRPPLVYGPGVRANFLTMMGWLRKGLPLPFGAVTNNKRSFVSVDNLVDLILAIAVHPESGNRVFLAGDGEDMSTTDLLRRLAKALGRPARLLSVPPDVLRMAAKIAGRADLASRLLDSLQVDISEARRVMGWHPPVPVDRALRKTAVHFLAQTES